MSCQRSIDKAFPDKLEVIVKAIRAQIAFTVILWSIVAVRVQAQVSPHIQEPTRISIGVSLVLADPKEDFGRNVNNGIGGAASFVYYLDRKGWLGVRFDGGGSAYGHEEKQVPLSETI